MTTPSTFGTAERLIDYAMHDAGLLQEGDVPNSYQLASNLNRLNDLVNLWQTQGLKLFLYSDTSVPLVVGQAKYTFNPSGNVAMAKPLQGLQAYYLDATGVRRPLTCLSWDEYLRLGQVNQNGQINSYFVDKQSTSFNVTFWYAPDAVAATGTAHILLRTQAPQLAQLTSQTIFPPEWYIALRWGLANDICTSQPQDIRDRCEKRAATYRTALDDWDVEDAATTFAPDARAQYFGNSFR